MKNIIKKIFFISILLILIISYVIINSIGDINIFAATVIQETISDINWLEKEQYFKIMDLIDDLQRKHPNWKFEILYTDLKWEDVIYNEYTCERGNVRNAVSQNNPEYIGEWICGVCGNIGEDVKWCAASKQAISYMMDVRNWINEIDIFQFMKLDYKDCDDKVLKSMVKDTFLDNESYINAIKKAGEDNKVSPYFLVATILQENGEKGSVLTKGEGYKGEYVNCYNVFNIGQRGKSEEQEILKGLQEAYIKKWDSIEDAILGGAAKVVKDYINVGQNTLYFQKFDVENSDGELYWNYYMQDISATKSEADRIRNALFENERIDNEYTFIIPVFKEMPEVASRKPSISTQVTKMWNISKTEDDNVIATLDDNGVLSISGSGEMKDWTSMQADWYRFCSEIQEVKIGEGVTNIGNYAFEDLKNLKDIEIPEDVTSIGNNAFYGCTNLEELYIPEQILNINDRAFMRCDKLGKVVITEETTELGDDIFYKSPNVKVYCKSNSPILEYVKNKEIYHILDNYVPIITAVTGDNNGWTNSNIILTVTATDDHSGILEYSFDGGNTWTTNNYKEYEKNQEYIDILVKDKLGNISAQKTCQITHIDKDEPEDVEISFSVTEWTNQNVIVTVNAQDKDSGLYSCKFGVRKENNEIQWEDIIYYADNSKPSKTYTENTDGICIEVSDLAGNTVIIEDEIIDNIDKQSPIIKITPNGAETSIRQEVTISIENEDGSDLSDDNEYEYQLSTSSIEPTGEWEEYDDGEPFEIGEGLAGEYYLWVRSVKDEAGNNASDTNYVVSEKFIFDPNTAFIRLTPQSGYSIEGDYIVNIAPGTDVDSFLDNIISKYEDITLCDAKDFEIEGEELVTTNSIITIRNKEGTEYEYYFLVVKGDVTGDGIMNLNDAIRILAHIAGGNNPKLTGAYYRAAQIINVGQITTNDVIRILQYCAE